MNAKHRKCNASDIDERGALVFAGYQALAAGCEPSTPSPNCTNLMPRLYVLTVVADMA